MSSARFIVLFCSCCEIGFQKKSKFLTDRYIECSICLFTHAVNYAKVSFFVPLLSSYYLLKRLTFTILESQDKTGQANVIQYSRLFCHLLENPF